MQLKVDASDLLKWARYYENIPRVTKPALARALNTYGNGVVQEVVRVVSDQNGWDPDAVRQRIVTTEADPQHLEYSMDASLVTVGNAQTDWSRDWSNRDTSNFDQDTLVQIITSGDACVCPVCEQVAEDGPYTMQQLNDMQAQWACYVPPTPNIAPGVITNLVHPRCRCVAQPWTSYRRLPVSGFAPEGSGGNVASTPPMRQMSMRQLAKALAPELLDELRQLKITVT